MFDIDEEYIGWVEAYGDGRSDDDQRFGQYLSNTFDVEMKDTFFAESATEVYKIIKERWF